MTGRANWSRLAAAVLLTPLPAMIVIAIISVLFTTPEATTLIGPIIALAMFGVAFAYPAILVLGLPAHIALNALGRRGLIDYAAVGAISGFITLLVISAWDGRQPLLWLTPIALGAGVCNAVVFWLIRRPDRDAPNPPTSAP